MLTTSVVNKNSNAQNSAKNTSVFNRLISLLGQQAGNPLLASRAFSSSTSPAAETSLERFQKKSATFNSGSQPTITQKGR